jgi:hypothetical protein
VHASVANEYFRIALTANAPGPQGEGISVVIPTITTATTNTAGALLLLTAYNPTLCCSNVEGQLVSQENPAVPGELLYTFATGLGVTNPQDVDTGRIFPGGSANPPVVAVDSILTGGTTANVVSVGLLPGTVGVYYVQFQLNSGIASNTATQMTIAQQAFVSNVVTFPVAVPGLGTHLVVQPDTLKVTSGGTVNFTVTALDYKGNIATSYTGTVHLTSSDGSATIPANAALAAGVGTFAVTFNTPGLQSITVTDVAATSINGTSPGVTVSSASGLTVSSATKKRPLKNAKVR